MTSEIIALIWIPYGFIASIILYFRLRRKNIGKPFYKLILPSIVGTVICSVIIAPIIIIVVVIIYNLIVGKEISTQLKLAALTIVFIMGIIQYFRLRRKNIKKPFYQLILPSTITVFLSILTAPLIIIVISIIYEIVTRRGIATGVVTIAPIAGIILFIKFYERRILAKTQK